MQIPNGSMRLRSNVKYQLLVGSPKHFHVHQRTAEDYQHVAFSEWQSHGHQAKGDPVDTSLMSSCSAWIRSTSSTPSTSFFFFFSSSTDSPRLKEETPSSPWPPQPLTVMPRQRGGRDRLPGQRETTQQHHRLPCALPEGTTRPENRPQACHTVTWILKCYLSKKIKRSFLSCCPGTKVKQTHEGWSNQNQLPRHARPRFSTRASAC